MNNNKKEEDYSLNMTIYLIILTMMLYLNKMIHNTNKTHHIISQEDHPETEGLQEIDGPQETEIFILIQVIKVIAMTI